jgi:hypothetical protein
MHRTVLPLLMALILALGTAGPAVALQDASPAAEGGLADVGMPQLSITVTESGYEGIPEEVEAGRYLVILTATEETEEGGGIAFVQPPDGMSGDEFVSAVFGGPDESGVGMADGSPVVGMEASPEASPAASPAASPQASPVDEGASGVPDFLFDATFAGGTYAPPGGSNQVVLDLTPGEWVAWADDPEAPQEPVVFEVTGEMPAELPEPDANATITMGEYIIEVSEGELVAGRNIVRIDNIGAQPHFIVALHGPDDMTLEKIEVALQEEMDAGMSGSEPVYSDFNPNEDFSEEGSSFTGTQSMNTSIWVEMDLEAGMYFLACFFPDLSDGMPHAYHGMYNVVEVTG